MTNAKDDFTAAQLKNLAQLGAIEGRSKMNKDQLYEALEEQMPHLLSPFAQVGEVEEGAVVNMNHLAGDLHVTDVREESWNDGEFTRTEVVMETIRGGRHKLVAHKTAPYGKNGADPHLERWRAGDQEWMNNSTDPQYFLIEEDAEDDDE